MEVYPRVKVRQHDEDEDGDDEFVLEEDTTSFPSLDGFDSLCLQPTVSPVITKGKEDLNDSQLSITRVSKSHISNLTLPPISVSKGIKRDKTETDNDGGNARATQVLRPRAVLSSPDNDGMIGNIKQKPRERNPVRKGNDPQVKEPAQGKMKPRSVKSIQTTNLTKSPKEINLKEKQGLEPTVTGQKQYRRKGKLKTMGVEVSGIAGNS